MRIALFAFVFALLSLAQFAFAASSTDLGEFTCPSGQVEDIQCAAQCCTMNGGEYSYGEETCEVDSVGAWNAAMDCETQMNCCTSAGGNDGSAGSGCCGGGFILAGLALAAFTFLARSG